MEQHVTVDAKVMRGQASWGYFYVVLAFVLSIEGTVIQMITPLEFPWNLLAYAVSTPLTVWFFLTSRWLHNKLIGLKIGYEDKAR